jgi:hypothetical protein
MPFTKRPLFGYAANFIKIQFLYQSMVFPRASFNTTVDWGGLSPPAPVLAPPVNYAAFCLKYKKNKQI